jgi:hypothetical protein
MLLQGGCKSNVFWISSTSSIGQRLLSDREDFYSMQTKPTQTWDWAGFSTRASQHLYQSLHVVVGVRYICPTLSLSLGVRLLCLRGMVVKRIVVQYILLHMWRASSPQSVVVNICFQYFSLIFENQFHLWFSTMFNMFEHWLTNLIARLWFILSLTFYVFVLCSQVCVSNAFQSQQKHPSTKHELGLRSVSNSMTPDNIVI